jgi:hypothetical protein
LVPFLCTYDDVLSWVDGFLQGHASAPSVRQEVIRGSVETALREIVGARDWACMKKPFRLQLQASQNTGTISYHAAAGTALDASEGGGVTQYPYQVTLTGGTWPAWATDGELRLGDDWVINDVACIYSPTVISLRPTRVPAADIAFGSEYVIGQACYPLPGDFVGVWAPAEKNPWFIGEYTPFEDWSLMDKYRTMSSIVRRWTYGPVANRYGVTGFYVYPYSSNTEEYDILMKNRPRPLRVSGQEAWQYQGTVSVAANSTAVTGSGTAFTTNQSQAVGSIIRFGGGTTKPTGTWGRNPFLFQQTVASIASDTALTLSAPSPAAFSAATYCISDPVDVQQHMFDAFMRGCERRLGHAMGFKDADSLDRLYYVALTEAKRQDSAVKQRQVAGDRSGPLFRLYQQSGNRPFLGG